MTRDRAFEIIDAYGAEPARWPADERAGVLTLAGSDDAVAQALKAALAAARPFDALLSDWAMDVPVQHFDAEALLPAPRPVAAGGIMRPSLMRPSLMRQSMMRWMAGGAVAASVALALVVLPMNGSDAPTNINTASPGSAGDAVELDESFTMFFTPTADEEDVI